MTDIAKRIDAVVRSHLAPTLHDAGFKRRARNFRQRGAEATQLINVQASQTNYGGQGRFTINLGVYFPAAAAFLGRYEQVDEPSLTDCPLSRRLGGLMPARRDTWWDVGPNTDAEALSREVTDAVVRYGVPWLKHTAVLVNAVADPRCVDVLTTKAALLLAMGDREAALAEMVSAIAQTDRPAGIWFAFAVAAGLEAEYRAARAAWKAEGDGEGSA